MAVGQEWRYQPSHPHHRNFFRPSQMTRSDYMVGIIAGADVMAGVFDLIDGNHARGAMWLLYAAAAVCAMFIH